MHNTVESITSRHQKHSVQFTKVKANTTYTTAQQQQQGTLSLCEEVKQQANTRKLN
jgi:hypothetical protein